MRAWHGIGRKAYTITVAAGTGYVDANLTGRLVSVHITAPSGSPDFSAAITDTNGRAMWADGPANGSEVKLDGKEAALYGKNRLTLSGATVQGDYTVTVYGLVQGGDWLVSSPT